MRRMGLIVVSITTALFIFGCGPQQDTGPDFDTGVPGGTSGFTKLSGEETALANQATIGESLRLPAGVLNGPIGEPPLEGDVILTLTTVVKGETISTSGRALGGGSSSAFFDPREGEYLVVIYTVKNETSGALQPSTHINGSFSLVDSEGRIWPGANYYSHGFEVPFALAIDLGIKDPRKFVDPDATVETAVGFDVPKDITAMKIRSELLGLEISFGE